MVTTHPTELIFHGFHLLLYIKTYYEIQFSCFDKLHHVLHQPVILLQLVLQQENNHVLNDKQDNNNDNNCPSKKITEVIIITEKNQHNSALQYQTISTL